MLIFLNVKIYLHILLISYRDHTFDHHLRRTTKSKMKEGTISKDRTAVEKGTLGVRWERARINQSKILQTDRMGIDI